MIESEPVGVDRSAAELLDAIDALGPEGEAVEELDLNDCNDWEFVP